MDSSEIACDLYLNIYAYARYYHHLCFYRLKPFCWVRIRPHSCFAFIGKKCRTFIVSELDLKCLFEYASVGICDYTLPCFSRGMCLPNLPYVFPAFLVLHIYLDSLGFIYRIYLVLDLDFINGGHATQFVFCWIGNYLHKL